MSSRLADLADLEVQLRRVQAALDDLGEAKDEAQGLALEVLWSERVRLEEGIRQARQEGVRMVQAINWGVAAIIVLAFLAFRALA